MELKCRSQVSEGEQEKDKMNKVDLFAVNKTGGQGEGKVGKRMLGLLCFALLALSGIRIYAMLEQCVREGDDKQSKRYT